MNTTHTTDTVVIGAGQAGLAVSHELTARGIEHVVLERHEAGARWRRETWDSLRLLTPNWMNVLPGAGPTGDDSDGFVTATAFADHLDRYAASFGAPVETGAAVEVLRRRGEQFEIATAAGTWRAGNVVVATGWCDQPVVPAFAADLDVAHVVPSRLPPPRRPRPRRRARRRRVGDRRPARPRAAPRRARRHHRRRTPHPRAADVPRHGHVLVARPDRRPRPDDRHDGRRPRCPPRAVAAARRATGPGVARPADAAEDRRPPGRAGDRRRRRHDRRRRRPRRAGGRRRGPARRDAAAHRRAHRGRRPRRRGARPRSAPAAGPDRPGRRARPAGGRDPDRRCGPPGTAASTRGCRSRCSTRPARSASTKASRRFPASTCSASASSTAGPPTSSAASASTPPSSPPTWRTASTGRCVPLPATTEEPFRVR